MKTVFVGDGDLSSSSYRRLVVVIVTKTVCRGLSDLPVRVVVIERVGERARVVATLTEEVALLGDGLLVSEALYTCDPDVLSPLSGNPYGVSWSAAGLCLR